MNFTIRMGKNSRKRPVVDESRRHFLRGVGGAALALPLLPSLLVKEAYACDPLITRRPRLFWMMTGHGGAFETNMFPSPTLLTRRQQLYADHEVASGDLVAQQANGMNVLSPVLQAPPGAFSPALMAKMNVIQGLDIPFYIAHHTGGHLGNYARNDGNGGDGGAVKAHPRPTIDQILGWSPSFYPDLANIRERVMVMTNDSVSYNYSTPSRREGRIENIRGYSSTREWFNRLFDPLGNATANNTPIVDLVLDSYRNLRTGSRRLSANDRQRLDDHMDRIAELQRRLQAPLSCTGLMEPTEDASSFWIGGRENAIRQAQLFNDLVTTAFMCGATRIAVVSYNDGVARFADSDEGSWHQGAAHQWNAAGPQQLIQRAYQGVFEHGFLDLANKLNVEEMPGYTYLDNSMMVWSQESGMVTHDNISMPVVTCGAAAGCMRTGQFLDYRRLIPASMVPNPAGNQYMGVLYNQFLATVLQTMRVPPTEFERWGHKGYGVPFVTQESWTPAFAAHYVNTSSRYFQSASDVLPYLGV